MLIGADYYPEHWDRSDWEPHARLMAEGGFKIVRMAEFAWSRMEPKEGQYDFSWLDEAISVLRKHNIQVILGTPTAAPPPWMTMRHPDILPVNQDGVRTEPGGRQHCCFSVPIYREFTRRMVSTMAQHYSDHPSVVAWQIDNEIGGPKCWCTSCAARFRTWLKTRYESVEKLNTAWGTVFWGQEYSDWDHIPLPRPSHASHSPEILLAHQRFHSDLVVEYHDSQVQVIRKLCPGKRVTHNFMGFYNQVDYPALAKSLDFASYDSYPGNVWGSGKYQGAPLDYTRSLKHKPWWVMEQRAGLTGWRDIFQSGDTPGQLRLWTYQAVAHGADAVIYFRWRTCRFGTEQYWHGILDHHGQPGRRYQELTRVGREFASLGDRLVGSEYEAQVGILFDSHARWAIELQRGSPDFNFVEHAGKYYRAFGRRNAGVEYYGPSDDLSRARVLVAPALFLCEDTLAAKLTDYVQTGGILVLSFRSGVKDTNNNVINDRLPGALKHIAGITVDEYDALVQKEEIAVEMLSPLPRRGVRASVWCDQLRLAGARALARYEAGSFRGSPAATVNRFGKGVVVYVGFQGDEGFYDTLAKWLLQQADIHPPIAPSDEIEVTVRTKGKERFLFLLNHSKEKQKVTLPGSGNYRDILTGQKGRKTVSIHPYDVKILTPLPPA